MKKIHTAQKGFTLIELLMVISIIGLLSSIVIGNVNSGREKGELAAKQKFATHNHRAIGAYGISQWDFDEGSGGIAYNSASNNPGVISGASWITDSSELYNKRGSALSFDGNDYVSAGIIDEISGSNPRSISVWIKTTNTSSAGFFDSARCSASYQAFQLFTVQENGSGGSPPTNPGGIALAMWNMDLYMPIGINAVADGEWHHIFVSIDSTGEVAMYFDGEKPNVHLWNSGWTTREQPFTLPQTLNTYLGNTYIGRTYCTYWGTGSSYFTGQIDEVRLYEDSLIASDVKRLYEKQKIKFLAKGL